MKPDFLRDARPLPWEETFAVWRANESANPHWQQHYRERGFTTWEEWRTVNVADPLRCAERSWTLSRIEDPLEHIPQFFGGPFRSWKAAHYGDADSLTFAELAMRPAVAQEPSIRQLMEHFPSETTVTGLLWKNRVVIIEGMHRCCAVAVAAQERFPLVSRISLAFAKADDPQLPILTGRRSSKK